MTNTRADEWGKVTDDEYDYERITQLWQESGGESGTRLENFTGGYKAGAMDEGRAAARLIDRVERALSKRMADIWLEHKMEPLQYIINEVDAALNEYEAGK